MCNASVGTHARTADRRKPANDDDESLADAARRMNPMHDAANPPSPIAAQANMHA